MKPAKKRLDQLLVDSGMVESRAKAQALILAGSVLVNQQKALKPGQTVSVDAQLQLLDQMRYVSRGGLKLEKALDEFGIDPEGKVCVDIGASTGGFTDCLLQRGAIRVYAVDVGPTQLHWRLQTDERVVIRDHTNARYLEAGALGEPCSLAVCDVSFISVTMILPAIPPLLAEHADLVVLIKPQFEAGRDQVGSGGIIRDPALHTAAVEKVQCAAQNLGFRTRVIDSPILGSEGNREFLLHAAR